MRPFLSIIIPTFNSDQTISYSLESILNQSFDNFEILIIDGVSTDNTLTTVRGYNDSRIKIFSEADKGIYDAMNKGIMHSKGEWIYFIGSDDVLFEPNTLDKIFSHEEIWTNDIIYGDVYSAQHGGRYNGEWSVEKIGYNLCHQSIFYKKSLLIKLGLYNLKYKVCADHDLNLKWFFSHKFKHRYINQIIAIYSNYGYSSITNDEIFEREMYFLILKRGLFYLKHKDLKIYCSLAAQSKKQHGDFLSFYSLNLLLYFLRLVGFTKRYCSKIFINSKKSYQSF